MTPKPSPHPLIVLIVAVASSVLTGGCNILAGIAMSSGDGAWPRHWSERPIDMAKFAESDAASVRESRVGRTPGVVPPRDVIVFAAVQLPDASHTTGVTLIDRRAELLDALMLRSTLAEKLVAPSRLPTDGLSEVVGLGSLLARANDQGASLLVLASMGEYTHGTDAALPIGLLTLGLAPTKIRNAEATVSVGIFDVSSGMLLDEYIEDAEAEQLGNWWTQSDAREDATARAARRVIERASVVFTDHLDIACRSNAPDRMSSSHLIILP